MSLELNEFFAKVASDQTLQQRLYTTKEVEDVASIAREIGFTVSGSDILRAQVGRVLMLPPQELESVAEGEKAKTGAQWGRGGKGYLDNAGYWLSEIICWGYLDSVFEPQMEAFLTKVKSEEIPKNEISFAKTFNAVSQLASKYGYNVSGAHLLRYQALQILKLNDVQTEMVAAGSAKQ